MASTTRLQPLLPSLQHQKLSPSDLREIRIWAETHRKATWQEIQKYIKNSLGRVYSEKAIYNHKIEWGFKKRVGKKPTSPLTDSQLETIKAWAKDNAQATNQEIQIYIKREFGIEYSLGTVQIYKKKWNFEVRAYSERSPSLTATQLETLKSWAKTHEAATNQEIQAHIKEAFKIEYVLRIIQRYRRICGFNPTHNSLTAAQLETLKAWAKTHKTATNPEIQAHIKEAFKIEHVLGTIQRYRRICGFSPIHYFMTDTQLKTLKSWAKTHEAATNQEIQAHIKEAFKIEYVPRIIQGYRKRWGFSPIHYSLTDTQLETLKAWAKTHEAATNPEIQAHIKKAFKIEYVIGTIKKYRKRWGFNVKNLNSHQEENLSSIMDQYRNSCIYPPLHPTLDHPL